MPNQRLLSDIITIIEEAGRNILTPAFRQKDAATSKPDGSIVTDTDIACQRFIKQALADIAPEIPFLGEEMDAHAQIQRLNAKDARYWCLDPLDGTSNFVAGIPVFAISLALIAEGRPVLACIHDPVRNETFTAIESAGSSLNGSPLVCAEVPALSHAVGYIDFKRLDTELKHALLAPGIFRSQRNIGSCALEWAWLAAGRGHFIIHGGEKLWDFAAGSLIASEAGCIASDFSRAPLFPCAYLTRSVAAACSRGIHASLLDTIHRQTPRCR